MLATKKDQKLTTTLQLQKNKALAIHDLTKFIIQTILFKNGCMLWAFVYIVPYLYSVYIYMYVELLTHIEHESERKFKRT